MGLIVSLVGFIRSLFPEQFLVLYAAVFLGLLFLCRRIVGRADRSVDLPPLPAPAEVDAFEVAYLRGGERGVAEVAVVALLQSGYLEHRPIKGFWANLRIFSSGVEGALSKNAEQSGEDLSPLLSEVCGWFSRPRGDLYLFPFRRLKRHNIDYHARLSNQYLFAITTPVERIVVGVSSLIILVLMVAAFLAWPEPWNKMGILFQLLFITSLIALFFYLIVFLISVYRGRLSERGKRYLKQLQQDYQELRYLEFTDMVGERKWELAVALFGIGVLRTTNLKFLDDMFTQPSE